MDLTALATVVASVAGLALITTKIVDGIRNAVDPQDNPKLKVAWNAGAFLVGIGVTYAFTAAGFDIAGAGPTTVGTGLLVGAAASGWHEGLDYISSLASTNKPATLTTLVANSQTSDPQRQ